MKKNNNHKINKYPDGGPRLGAQLLGFIGQFLLVIGCSQFFLQSPRAPLCRPTCAQNKSIRISKIFKKCYGSFEKVWLNFFPLSLHHQFQVPSISSRALSELPMYIARFYSECLRGRRRRSWYRYLHIQFSLVTM